MTVLLLLLGMLCPIAGMFCAVANFSTSRKAASNALVFGNSCGWAFYGYISDKGNDIIRHMSNLNLYREVSLFQGLDIKKNQVYLWDIWSWTISKFEDPYLLQASAALVGYSIIAYIVFDYANIRKFNLSSYVPMLLLALTVVSPLDVTNGVRFANSVLICTLAVYGYYVKKSSKIKTLILFVLAIFLHHASALVFVVWILMPIIKKYPIKSITLVFVVLLSFTNYDQYIRIFSGSESIMATLLADGAQSARNYRNTTASFHSLFVRYLQMIFNGAILIRGKMALKANSFEESAEKKISSGWSEYVWLFSATVFVIGFCLTITLGTNGNRFFIASMLLGLIPLMEIQTFDGFLRLKKYFVIDGTLLGCAMVCVALYLNDMNWGTGSVSSFIISLISGILSRKFLL